MKKLSASAIKQHTKFAMHITVENTVSSTNTELKKQAAKGAPEGTVLITEHQTAGRGRLGKQFFSPKGCGLYFSLLLRPTLLAKDAVLITAAAAVAVRRSLKHLLNLDTQIKWVNDIYYQGKKVCGILTETALSPHGEVAYAVLGIGINLLPPDGGYPEEFAYKTCSLADSVKHPMPADLKNGLVADILNEFYGLYKALDQKTYLTEYKAASCVIGKEIEIATGPYAGRALALDIDEHANLIARLPGGKTISLSSGDVSIHL